MPDLDDQNIDVNGLTCLLILSSYNVTTLEQSGALTTLKQFLSRVEDNHNNYLCFVPGHLSLKCPNNIRLVFIKKDCLSCILWDEYALKEWLRNNKLN